LSQLTIQLIQHGSQEYDRAVALRSEVLRRPLGLNFSKEELAAETDQLHVAAYVEGGLVACMILVMMDGKTLKMRQVAVDPEQQGKGIGTRLVSYAEELAIKKGYCRIELHARKTAVRFYEELAYEKTGEEFTEVTLPHFKMVKSWCV
jgi:ribosomal protein S18 acetylase RimI-like enzyme